MVKSYRPKTSLELVFSRYTPGGFSFNVPEKYNYIKINYAGAGGQEFYIADQYNNPTWGGLFGDGRVVTKNISIQNHTITGIIGAKPVKQVGLSHIGGSGYQNGGDATRTFVNYSAGGQAGGGGGSTSVIINGTTYTAGGGAGAGYSFTKYPPGTPETPSYVLYQAGNGGGPNGGVAETATYGASGEMKFFTGGDATDVSSWLNADDGFVEIYARYDPDYEQ